MAAATAAGIGGAGVAGGAGSALAAPAAAGPTPAPPAGITANSPGHRSPIRISPPDLTWSADYDGHPVVAPGSALGLVLDSGQVLGPNARVQKVAHRKVDTTWRPLYGRQAVLPDRYEE